MSIIVHILNETIVLQCIHKSWNKIGPSNFKIPNEVKAKNDTNGKNIIIKYLFTISFKNEILPKKNPDESTVILNIAFKSLHYHFLSQLY